MKKIIKNRMNSKVLEAETSSNHASLSVIPKGADEPKAKSD